MPSEMFLVAFVFSLIIATVSRATTCGYKDGDPKGARTAQPGYACRVDTSNGLWGFCPTSVVSAKDCGLAGLCVDSHACTEGCGRLSDRADITTFSCESSQFCSTVLLVQGLDQSFEYIACGARAQTDTLFPAPNTAAVTTTPSSSASLFSSYSTSPALRPTNTVKETSSVPDSSSSSVVQSSFISPTSGPTATSSKQVSTPLGAIVGGTLGGLTVICLTILGVVLIRRKHEFKGQKTLPPGLDEHGWIEFVDDATRHAHNDSADTKNFQPWGSGQVPVEMYSGRHINMEPVELSGQVHYMGAPKGDK